MVFLEAAKYRLQVFLALVALTITAAGTLAIPAASQLIVDRGLVEMEISVDGSDTFL